MRDRKQSGYIYKRGDWWVLRYRDDGIENGQIVRKHLARQLARVLPEHQRLKRPPPEVEDEAKHWLKANVNDSRREVVTLATIGVFVTDVYFKYVTEQKRPSTLKGYRDMWERHWRPPDYVNCAVLGLCFVF